MGLKLIILNILDLMQVFLVELLPKLLPLIAFQNPLRMVWHFNSRGLVGIVLFLRLPLSLRSPHWENFNVRGISKKYNTHSASYCTTIRMVQCPISGRSVLNLGMLARDNCITNDTGNIEARNRNKAMWKTWNVSLSWLPILRQLLPTSLSSNKIPNKPRSPSSQV
jgi:hypothetical protein